MGEKKKCIQCLCGESERKRLLGKPKWEDYIRILSQKMGWEEMDWIHLAEDWDK
jgi:hypothetical protein